MTTPQQSGKKIGPYNVFGTLGKGKCSRVSWGLNSETNEAVAIKTIDSLCLEKYDFLDNVKKDISILRAANSQYILKIYDVFSTRSRIVVAMELLSGRNLQDLLEQQTTFHPSIIRYFFSQICNAVSYCHSCGIVHGNLKLESILIDSKGIIRLTDFGHAHVFREEEVNGPETIHFKVSTAGISKYYIAPEIINDECVDLKKIDLWNMGVMLYAMSCGFLPFMDVDGDLVTLFKSVRLGNYRKMPDTIDPLLVDLIDRLLQINPDYRLSISQILQHPFMMIQDIDFNYAKFMPSCISPISPPSLTPLECGSTQIPVDDNMKRESFCSWNFWSLFCRPSSFSFSLFSFQESNSAEDDQCSEVSTTSPTNISILSTESSFGMEQSCCEIGDVIDSRDSTTTTTATNDHDHEVEGGASG